LGSGGGEGRGWRGEKGVVGVVLSLQGHGGFDFTRTWRSSQEYKQIMADFGLSFEISHLSFTSPYYNAL
jgi:hypothetical protein